MPRYKIIAGGSSHFSTSFGPRTYIIMEATDLDACMVRCRLEYPSVPIGCVYLQKWRHNYPQGKDTFIDWVNDGDPLFIGFEEPPEEKDSD